VEEPDEPPGIPRVPHRRDVGNGPERDGKAHPDVTTAWVPAGSGATQSG
jgi:hypothetical protein